MQVNLSPLYLDYFNTNVYILNTYGYGKLSAIILYYIISNIAMTPRTHKLVHESAIGLLSPSVLKSTRPVWLTTSIGEETEKVREAIVEIREEITKVMEGGEEAFKLRKEKYGF